jgi:predicted nucleotidyltransferase
VRPGSIMEIRDKIIREIVEHYPATQGIYLFGSYGTEDERADSDVDIALLLPPTQARMGQDLQVSRCRASLVNLFRRDVDLINARRVSTVFQKEIIALGRLIYCADQYAVEEFEMIVLSLYQTLNEERREILESFAADGRAYVV